MKKFILLIVLFAVTSSLSAQQWTPSEWSVMTHYDSEHLQQVALPLGGIGTGTVSLGGRGELRDWEIMIIPGKGFNTGTSNRNAPFFAVFTKDKRAGLLQQCFVALFIIMNTIMVWELQCRTTAFRDFVRHLLMLHVKYLDSIGRHTFK